MVHMLSRPSFRHIVYRNILQEPDKISAHNPARLRGWNRKSTCRYFDRLLQDRKVVVSGCRLLKSICQVYLCRKLPSKPLRWDRWDLEMLDTWRKVNSRP